jgi:hypothetical protein
MSLEHSYFCRFCGQPLPSGYRGHFHRECLKADKRRRIQEQRRKEAQRFKRWVRKMPLEQLLDLHRNDTDEPAQDLSL